MTQTVGTEARLKAAIDRAIEQHSVMCGSHQYRMALIRRQSVEAAT
jgi:hypothetical protein